MELLLKMICGRTTFITEFRVKNTKAPEHKDSCGASEKVAAFVVQNLME
jgi:hypothetical protein